MDIEQSEYDEIAELIHSETSPVGIDAKKTHILILQLLKKIDAKVDALQQALEAQNN